MPPCLTILYLNRWRSSEGVRCASNLSPPGTQTWALLSAYWNPLIIFIHLLDHHWEAMCLCVCNYHEERQSPKAHVQIALRFCMSQLMSHIAQDLSLTFFFHWISLSHAKFYTLGNDLYLCTWEVKVFWFRVLIQMNVFVFSNCPCWSNSNLGQVDVYIWWSRSLHFETVGILSWRQFLHFWTILYSTYILRCAFQTYLCSFKISIEMDIQWQIASR